MGDDELLTPLAEICIELINNGMLIKEDIPQIIKQEVLDYYKSLRGGEKHG